MGQAVKWAFQGVDDNTKDADGVFSTRLVTVLLDRVPQGAAIVPSPGNSVTQSASIQWTPTQVESGTFDIILRDMDRCLINEKHRSFATSTTTFRPMTRKWQTYPGRLLLHHRR